MAIFNSYVSLPEGTLRSEAHAKHLHVQRGYVVVLQMVEIQLDGFSLSL